MKRKTTLSGYERINDDQGYGTIGNNIVGQINTHGAAEILYRKLGQVTYEAHAARICADERPLRNMVAIDSVVESELPAILDANLINLHKLPEKIRVIRPNQDRDSWTVFFSAEAR
ncbi:hypothetical protein KA107_00645 [Candidatus Pacearchaeota archaeon]|nr:hypothetical protein [Candidatus Pacearchaeota archaeon]